MAPSEPNQTTTAITQPSSPAGAAALPREVGQTAKATQLMLLTLIALMMALAIGLAITRLAKLKWFGARASQRKKFRLTDPWAEAGKRARPEDALDPDQERPA